MYAPMTRGVAAYQQTQVESRSPLELVVMLYDGALRFSAAAREAIARQDVAARGDAVSRLLGIIAHLQSTLNLEQGGQVATALDALYDRITVRALDVTLRGDVTALDEIDHVLRPLRDGWAEIASPLARTGTDR